MQPQVQQIDDQCYPELRLYFILWLTEKLFYLKVLIERLEENLYVTPCPVHLCDVFRADGKIVSQNYDGLPCLFVDWLYPPQFMRTLLPRLASRENYRPVIRYQGWFCPPRFNNLIPGVVLEPCYEKDSLVAAGSEPLVIAVPLANCNGVSLFSLICQECYSRVPLHSSWKGSPARCCWCRTSCWFLHRSWCPWILPKENHSCSGLFPWHPPRRSPFWTFSFHPCPMFRESCRTASQKPRISCAVRIGYGGPLYILRNPEMIQGRPVWVEWISQTPQSIGVFLTHLSNWGLGTVAKFTKTA